MNGIHDVGGMTTFGPLRREEDEPVFHADWERRVFALNMAAMAFHGPIDRARHAVEKLDPLTYLRSSYYERWLAGIEILQLDLGLSRPRELETGVVEHKAPLEAPAPDADMIEGLVRGGMPATRDDGRQAPKFAPGDRVRARNTEVTGHTRLPGYARGKTGVVILHHGTHAFADTAAHDRGENPQPLYAVRFDARELWGDNVTRRDCVTVDLWEDYLEPAV